MRNLFVLLLVAAFVLLPLFAPVWGQVKPAAAFDCSEIVRDNATLPGGRADFILSMQGWAVRQGADVRWDRYGPVSNYDPSVAPQWTGGQFEDKFNGQQPKIPTYDGKLSLFYNCYAAAKNSETNPDWRWANNYPNRYIKPLVSAGDPRDPTYAPTLAQLAGAGK